MRKTKLGHLFISSIQRCLGLEWIDPDRFDARVHMLQQVPSVYRVTHNVCPTVNPDNLTPTTQCSLILMH